jgi:hypothetical protein
MKDAKTNMQAYLPPYSPVNYSLQLHCFFDIVGLEMCKNMQLELQAVKMRMLDLFLFVIA